MKKYPKVRTVGHRDINMLLVGTVSVQEKVDGSNFSFGKAADGKPFAWSREQVLDISEPDRCGMFAPGVRHVVSILDQVQPGWIFRCEYLQRPKHNVLAYSRVPRNHLVLFETERVNGDYYANRGECHTEMRGFAEMFDIDVVPLFHFGPLTLDDLSRSNPDSLRNQWFARESFLGGPRIEGVVIKNFYQTDTRSGATYLVGKVVQDSFKEQHQHQVKSEKADPIEEIGRRYGVPARWRKAVQYLRDNQLLSYEMEDVPKLLSRVRKDIEEECEQEIKDALWKLYRKNVLGNTTKGLAQWYQQQLEHPITAGEEPLKRAIEKSLEPTPLDFSGLAENPDGEIPLHNKLDGDIVPGGGRIDQ